MGHGVVSPAVLDREIEVLYGWYAYHESVVAGAEQQRGLSRRCALSALGWTARPEAPGAGLVAAGRRR
jgi:hypothetical protein